MIARDCLLQLIAGSMTCTGRSLPWAGEQYGQAKEGRKQGTYQDTDLAFGNHLWIGKGQVGNEKAHGKAYASQ